MEKFCFGASPIIHGIGKSLSFCCSLDCILLFLASGFGSRSQILNCREKIFFIFSPNPASLFSCAFSARSNSASFFLISTIISSMLCESCAGVGCCGSSSICINSLSSYVVALAPSASSASHPDRARCSSISYSFLRSSLS